MLELAFFRYNDYFQLFGFEHVMVLIATVLIAIFLPMLALKWPRELQVKVSRGMAILIAVWVVLYPSIRALLGDFDPTTDLPLDICNIAGLISVFVMWNPNRKAHEILYFFILSGTFLALITPHLYNGFPNYTCLKYWIVHSGLVVYAIYNTVVFRLYPNWRSYLKAIGVLHIYVGFAYLANLLIGSNYFYIMHKPPTASPVDYMGPWPWYILTGVGVVIVFWTLILIPSLVAARRLKKYAANIHPD